MIWCLRLCLEFLRNLDKERKVVDTNFLSICLFYFILFYFLFLTFFKRRLFQFNFRKIRKKRKEKSKSDVKKKRGQGRLPTRACFHCFIHGHERNHSTGSCSSDFVPFHPFLFPQTFATSPQPESLRKFWKRVDQMAQDEPNKTAFILTFEVRV